MNPYIDDARDRLAAVLAQHDTLQAIYDGPAPRTDPAKQHRSRTIAALHEGIRFGLKAAEVDALLAIAHALEAPVVDEGPCGDWSPLIQLGDRDAGRSTCVLAHGHDSPVHRDADGTEWTELPVDDQRDPMPADLPDKALSVIKRHRDGIDQ